MHTAMIACRGAMCVFEGGREGGRERGRERERE